MQDRLYPCYEVLPSPLNLDGDFAYLMSVGPTLPAPKVQVYNRPKCACGAPMKIGAKSCYGCRNKDGSGKAAGGAKKRRSKLNKDFANSAVK